MKCLEKDRTRRYETANGLAMDLRRFIANEPVLARPPSLEYRVNKWVRRHWLGFAAGSVIFAAIIGALCVSTFFLIGERRARRAESDQRSAADTQRRLAEANERRMRRILYAADINLAQQAIEVSNFGRARALLDRTIPHVNEEDLRDWEWRYLWKQCQPDPYKRIGSYSSPVTAAEVSPDGHYLALVVDGTLSIWDLPSTKLIKQLSAGMQSHRRSVSWSPDGSLLAACLRTEGITWFEVGSWEVAGSYQSSKGARSPAFSPDGRRLAIRTDQPAIAIIDIRSRSLIETLPTPSSIVGFGGVHVDPICFSPDGETIATGGGSGTILLWRKDSGWRQLRGGLEDTVTALAFLPDGLRNGKPSGRKASAVTVSVDPPKELTPHSESLRHRRMVPDHLRWRWSRHRAKSRLDRRAHRQNRRSQEGVGGVRLEISNKCEHSYGRLIGSNRQPPTIRGKCGRTSVLRRLVTASDLPASNLKPGDALRAKAGGEQRSVGRPAHAAPMRLHPSGKLLDELCRG